DSIDDNEANSGDWQGNMFEVTTGGSASDGDVFNVALEALDVAVQNMVVTNAAATTANGWMLDLDTTAAWTGIAMDVDFGTAASTGNFLDVTYADAAHTGDTIAIATGTNLEGNAMQVTTAGIRTAPVFFVDGVGTDGGTDDHIIDINQSGLLNSNVLDITYSSGASDGNAIDLNMGTNVAGNALAIATAGTTAGRAIEIISTGTINDSLVDVDMASGDWQGNILEITTGGSASDGDVFNINLEPLDVAVQNMVVSNAAASSTAGWLLDLDTNAAWSGDAIDVRLTTAVSTGDFFVVTYADAAHTGDAFQVDMGTNLEGNAMQVTTAGIRTAPVFFVDGVGTDGGTDDHIIDINQSGLLNSNVLDITYSSGASDGNAIDLNMGTNVAGDAMNIVTAATTGQAIEIGSTGDFQNNLVDITTTAAWDGNVLGFDDTGNVIWTGNVIDLTTGTGNATGNLVDLAIEASANGDVQAIVLNASGPLDQAGWAMEVNAGGVFTASAFDFDITAVSAIASGDIFSFDSSGNAAFTSNIIDIDTGTGVATGNLVDLTIEAGSTAATAIAVSNAAVTAMGTDVGWLIAATGSAAFTSNMIDLNTTSTSSGNILDVTYSTAAATGNALDLNMGTNVAGNALDIATSATSGNAIDITTAGIFSNELIDINLGAQASTGEVINIAMGSTGLLTQAIAVSNGAASASGVDVGWLIAATGSGVFTSNMIDLNSSSTGSGNIVDVTYGASAATGNALDLNMVGNVAGDALNIASAATTGQAIEIGSTGDFQNNLVDITTTAAWDGNVLGFDDTGNVIWTGNVIDLTTGTGNATGNLVDLAIEASANGDVQAIVLNASGPLDQAGWAVDINATGIFTGAVIDIDTAATSSGNILDVTYATNVATGNAVDLNMGTNVAGNAIDIATSATTGNAIDITTAGIFANELIDINLGAQASTGSVIDINMGSTGLLTQAIVVSNGAISASGADVGWLIAATGSAAFTSNMIDLNTSGTSSTGNIIDVTYAGTTPSGNALDLNMATNVAGTALDISTGTTSGQAINVVGTGILTEDLITLINTGDTATATVDLLSISYIVGDGASVTNSAISVLVGAKGTAVGDIATGIYLTLSTQTDDTDTTKAIKIDNGDVWDRDIEFQNAEYVANSTDDEVTFFGIGGTNDTDLRFDLDAATSTKIPVIDSPTGGTIQINDVLIVDLQVSTINGSDEGVCASPDSDNSNDNVILADCNATPAADYAERYPVQTGATYG
ncbi:MAG: hypothetical protein AABZ46_06035, partial [Nitrospirota bacterium]